VFDVLSRHANVVGDLVDLVALLSARENAGRLQILAPTDTGKESPPAWGRRALAFVKDSFRRGGQ
jgi:hypothetical protein